MPDLTLLILGRCTLLKIDEETPSAEESQAYKDLMDTANDWIASSLEPQDSTLKVLMTYQRLGPNKEEYYKASLSMESPDGTQIASLLHTRYRHNKLVALQNLEERVDKIAGLYRRIHSPAKPLIEDLNLMLMTRLNVEDCSHCPCMSISVSIGAVNGDRVVYGDTEEWDHTIMDSGKQVSFLKAMEALCERMETRHDDLQESRE